MNDKQQKITKPLIDPKTYALLEKARRTAQNSNPNFFYHSEFWHKWHIFTQKMAGFNYAGPEDLNALADDLIRIAREETPTIMDNETEKIG